MSDSAKFGVVKPADKNEKVEKSLKPSKPKQNGDTQLRDELVKTDGLRDDVVKAGLVKPKKEKKKAAEKPAEKKEDTGLKQHLAKYIEEVKKRHPNLPSELAGRMKECPSGGAAKRMLRDHLRCLSSRVPTALAVG